MCDKEERRNYVMGITDWNEWMKARHIKIRDANESQDQAGNKEEKNKKNK